jgi:hypothetical protein
MVLQFGLHKMIFPKKQGGQIGDMFAGAENYFFINEE